MEQLLVNLLNNSAKYTDSANSVSRLLERRGPLVRVVHDGLTALEIAQHFRPDTFLLDLGLPGMDGYQLASELRCSGFSDALFVAISGYAQPQDFERSHCAGFQHHLAKPVDIEHIKEVLTSASHVQRGIVHLNGRRRRLH
jgi:CheY-like chemotaxis protein